MIKEKIISKYGKGGLKRSILNLGGDTEQTIKEIMSGRGIDTMIEIGTYKGVSAAVFAQNCRQVITFDLAKGRLEQTDPKWSRQELWDYLGCTNIKSHLIKNDNEKKSIIDKLEFQFAFIDGGHDTKSVTFDFNLVKRCGLVLFHDFDYKGVKGQDDVYDFVNSLSPKVKVYENIFGLWCKNG